MNILGTSENVEQHNRSALGLTVIALVGFLAMALTKAPVEAYPALAAVFAAITAMSNRNPAPRTDFGLAAATTAGYIVLALIGVPPVVYATLAGVIATTLAILNKPTSWRR